MNVFGLHISHPKGQEQFRTFSSHSSLLLCFFYFLFFIFVSSIHSQKKKIMASVPSRGWEPAIEDGPEIDGDLLMALLERLGHSIMKIMNIGWIMYWEPLDWMMAKALIHSTGLIWIWLPTLTVLTWAIGMWKLVEMMLRWVING